MDEKEKPFDVVSIVILLILSLANDGLEIFFDLLAATVIGLPGEAIMEPIDLAMDGIVTFWFFAKCGFGGPSIIQLVDDLLELIGIPGRTICVVAGILIANNPKLAAVVEVAGAAALTGGAGAVAAEAGTTAEVGVAATEGAAAGAEATAEIGAVEGEAGGAVGEARGGQPSEEGVSGGEAEEGEEGRKERLEEEEEKMEPEAERPPEEVEEEKLFEQTPEGQRESEEEENEDEEDAGQNASQKPLSIDDLRKLQHAKEVKERLEHPKAPQDVTTGNEEEDEELAA